MHAEVLAVGTELLLGDIVNTNAAYIGRALAAIGIDCLIHTTVGDNEERIASAIATATARADAVIITGGLGPTQDDVTRESLAACTGRALSRDAAIEERLRARFRELGREMPAMNLRQADVPAGARVIEQTFGTAPGLIVPHGACVIYAVPGVPAEMQDMLERAVLPDLVRRAGASWRIVSRAVRAAGMTESGVAQALSPAWDSLRGQVTMAFLAGGGEVRVRLTAKATDEAGARTALDAAEAVVRATLGSAVVGVDAETLEVVVGRMLAARAWTLACAESLTGGGLGARITNVAGASAWFAGSIVAYATEVKSAVLGVPTNVLASYGAVSEETARAMATRVRATLAADIGLAVTGVAGPTEQGRDVGTVIVAVDGPLGAHSREIRFTGGRAMVRQMATAAALNLLRLYLLGELHLLGDLR